MDFLLERMHRLNGAARDAQVALELLEAVKNHAKTKLDQARGRQIQIAALTAANRLDEACTLAVDAMRQLGVDVPDPSDKAALGAAIGAKFGAFQAARAGRDVHELVDLPPMTDATQLGS